MSQNIIEQSGTPTYDPVAAQLGIEKNAGGSQTQASGGDTLPLSPLIKKETFTAVGVLVQLEVQKVQARRRRNVGKMYV